MSAICGIYYHGGKLVCPSIGMAMLDSFKPYHADDRGTWYKEEVFLACHAQHITPESVNEKLPLQDEQADLTITADAIIDNRLDLFTKLEIPESRRDGYPDSTLILDSYKKWGKECPKHLIGDFAFAIWDGKRKELFCAVDAMGTRTLYYSHRNGVFAFSTLMKSLFVLPEIERKLNETWIADFLALPTIMHQLDAELTLYENVYLLHAGHTLTMGKNGIEKALYWQVTHQPELRLSSDAEYVEAFLGVFGEAVRCRMRSRRPVGVMMSGGLDSTSVACVAAKELASKGQRLQVFSAVPMEGYIDSLYPTEIADETPYIEAVRKHAGNIDVKYCRSEGKHSLSDTSHYFSMLEQPYKIIQNMFWLERIMAEARDKQIGILLDGQGGNGTVSWGDIEAYAITLARKGKWHLWMREARAYAVRSNLPFANVLKRLIMNSAPCWMRKVYFRLKRYENTDMITLSPVNAAFAHSHHVVDRFRQFNYDPHEQQFVDTCTARCQMFDTKCSSHLGPIYTKQSLAHYVARRDPTIDKRLIEFCMSLPDNQYVRNGEERRLIRQAMKSMLPDEVRLNESLRGFQSADWLQRLLPHWQDIVLELRNIGEQELEQRYLDTDRIQQIVESLKTPASAAVDDGSLSMLMRSMVFSRFLRYEFGNY